LIVLSKKNSETQNEKITMRQQIDPPGTPPLIGPFSPAILAQGRTLYVSGQGPQDPVTKGFRLGNIEEETRLTLDNVTRLLHGAGADWSHVVKVGVYLTRMEDFAAFNRVYSEYLVTPSPARTTIICSLLAGISVEVDCIAVID
jgi:2-iminobutanoate/2-iminopropanoate deaminase